MTSKTVVAVILSAAVPAIGFAQSPTATLPKPILAQVRKLVQMISNNKAKLKVYCQVNELDVQLEEADRQKDRQALEALNAKADSLEKQISPDYTQIMDALELLDPNSAEGKTI
jgi:hypothetical protein